jgi:hypothetical protein
VNGLRDLLRSTTAHLRLAAASALRFFGPVAGAVKGQISKEEWVRAATKAVVVAGATRATLWASLTAPDALSDVVVPVAAAALAGALDALSRYHQGDTLRPTGER